MKTCTRNIIKFNYGTKVLSIIASVSTLLLIAIIAMDESSVLSIIVPLFIISVVLLVIRTLSIKKVLDRIKDNKVEGKVTGTRRNNGNFYMSFEYEFNGETYKNKACFLIGPLQRIKLAKMETVNLVVDDLNPKKAFISDLHYK